MSDTVLIPRIKTREPESAEPDRPDAAVGRFGLSARWRSRLPLAAVLMVQASIAVTLTNTAFVDEACYLFS